MENSTEHYLQSRELTKSMKSYEEIPLLSQQIFSRTTDEITGDLPICSEKCHVKKGLNKVVVLELLNMRVLNP